MITDGSYHLIGIKNIDITKEIDNIISKALNTLIICGYSFTKTSNKKSTLLKIINSNARIKHCIFPISLFMSKDYNRYNAIELINNGVSVSLEPNNHSKWLLNENEMYFGSLNFTTHSIEKRIEVVTFKKFDNFDILKNEFLDFTIDSIKRMKSISHRNKIRSVITRNQKLYRINSKRIKRLNPSIRKIYSTINSIPKVKASIDQMIVNVYWLLEDQSYFSIFRNANTLFGDLSHIYDLGNRIILNYENDMQYSKIVEKYNYSVNRFQDRFEFFIGKSKNLIGNLETLPEISQKNKDLSIENVKILKEMINR